MLKFKKHCAEWVEQAFRPAFDPAKETGFSR
jgi:hypothetical protein